MLEWPWKWNPASYKEIITMRTLITVTTCCLLTIAATSVFAAGPRLEPIQSTGADTYLPPSPDDGTVVATQPIPVAECAVPLYRRVKYRDERKIAPCAVPMVVMVPDPCWCDDPCDPCDKPACVAVQICVPPCSECPPKVTCRRGGACVRYDFGKYAVDIRSHRGVVVVDYDRRLLF